jgi:hypothetical protein
MFPASRRTGAVARPRTRQGAVQPLRRGLQVSETSGGAQGAVRDSWESHNSSAQRRLLLRRSCARMRRQVVVSTGVPRWGTTACGLRRQRWGWASWLRPWLRASAPQPPARALPADGTESWYASCLTGELSRAVCDTSPHSPHVSQRRSALGGGHQSRHGLLVPRGRRGSLRRWAVTACPAEAPMTPWPSAACVAHRAASPASAPCSTSPVTGLLLQSHWSWMEGQKGQNGLTACELPGPLPLGSWPLLQLGLREQDMATHARVILHELQLHRQLLRVLPLQGGAGCTSACQPRRAAPAQAVKHQHMASSQRGGGGDCGTRAWGGGEWAAAAVAWNTTRDQPAGGLARQALLPATCCTVVSVRTLT